MQYKAALIAAHYRNWIHRVLCWLGDTGARQAETTLIQTTAAAKGVVNASAENQRLVRSIAMEQPEMVRERDRFIALIG